MRRAAFQRGYLDTRARKQGLAVKDVANQRNIISEIVERLSLVAHSMRMHPTHITVWRGIFW